MAHRTALIAAGSIAIAVLAAAVALGANMGILDAADSRPAGQMSAVADTQQGSGMLAGAPDAAPTIPQEYVIKKAGTLSVTATPSGLRLDDVTARSGWTWALSQSGDSRLTVTFKSGPHQYKFVATLDPDGSVAARVDRPVTKAVPSAGSEALVANSASPPTVTGSSSAPANTSDHEADGHDEGAEADD